MRVARQDLSLHKETVRELDLRDGFPRTLFISRRASVSSGDLLHYNETLLQMCFERRMCVTRQMYVPETIPFKKISDARIRGAPVIYQTTHGINLADAIIP